MSLDFFKGVNNLNQGRTYQRNDSGRDFIRGPLSPSSPRTQSRSIQDRRRDVNENVHVRHQQDHVPGHGSRAHPYPSHQEYSQLHQFIPHEHPRSIEPATNNYNIPNAPFFQAPPFPYNEGPPRTSAHFHGCPTCSSPIMVQVTANLSYHHVTLIPAAAAAKNSYTESTLPSHGAQEYSPNPESIPQTYDPESSDDDSLSNDMVVAAAAEKQPEMVAAPRDEVQPLLSVETKLRRSYASITAGKIIINENHYKPSEEEADSDKPLEEEANNDKPPPEEEANNVKPSEEEAKDNNNSSSQVDVAFDINGFTTVVSSKSKKKAKAEAKAAAIAARKKMFSKHRRWPERDEHDKQHYRNDRRAGREHDQHAKDKHHGRSDAKDIGQKHT